MNDHVQTAIRWRPPLPNREISIEKVDDKILSVGRQNRTFLFDHVFDGSAATTNSSQLEVYNVLVKPLIEKAFEGYDCTFLAIGQTGSGKTYTVGFDQSVVQKHHGMTARVLQSIFSYQNAEQVKVLISFIEIYKEQAFDLLAESQQEPFYSKDNRFDEPTKKSVKSEIDVLTTLAQASKKRHVRNTNMNSASSRSHAVFTIFLGVKHAGMDIRESTINIVDLAGSEGFAKTGNVVGSEAHMESKSINESLSAFKRVIKAMSCGQDYIPFRDSVITTLLRKALNPQSYLTLLGCVSPYYDDYGETLSTIHFVAEAKQIKKTPQLNALINDFQKSKTPVKIVLQTPNSSFNLPTNAVFKRPSLMSVGNPNKRPLPFSMSLPPKKLSFASNSSEFYRFERKSELPHSTTKKSNVFNRNEQLISLTDKPKAVANLFPMPLTPSRRLIENLLNNKNTKSNETMHFCHASTSTSTSSTFGMNPVSVPSSSEGIRSHLGDIVNLLAGPAFQLLSSEVEKRMAENPDQKSMPNQIMESFCAVLNKLLSQNASNESLTSKNLPELSPLVEKSADESGLVAASSGIQNEILTNDESIKRKRFSNSITVDIDHAEKQIIVEVHATPADASPVSTSPLPLASASFLEPDSERNVNFSSNGVESGLDVMNHLSFQCENLADQTGKMEISNQTMDKSLDQTVLEPDIDETFNRSYETPINDSMTVHLTPIVERSESVGKRGTPIGMIQLRHKVNTLNDLSTDRIAGNTAYEILMVNKDRISPVKKVRFDNAEKIIHINSHDGNVDGGEIPIDTSYALPTSQAIASKSTATDRQFPIAPKTILERINLLEEFNQKIMMPISINLLSQKKRASKKSLKVEVAPLRTMSELVDTAVLNVLNAGTQKQLASLVTIGPKTAAQIIQNRVEHGQFEHIDSMLRMPFWSRKKHRRFVERNL